MKNSMLSFKFNCLITIPAILLLLFLGSCINRSNINSDQTVNNTQENQYKDFIKGTSAPEWAEMLRNYSGWIGADGVYAVALNGVETPGTADETETFIWFSDSIIGEFDENGSLKENWEMVNNSVAYMQGGTPDPSNIEFYWRTDEEGSAKSVFVPSLPDIGPDEYYWLGDGFFNHAMDSTIYIFGYLIRNVPGEVFPFEQVGVTLIALPKGSRPPFPDQYQIDTPLFLEDEQGRGTIVFGSAILVNTEEAGASDPDGYIYVYGLRGPNKELLVARVRDHSFEDFSEWRYWDGRTWNTDVHQSAALTSRVSNEMSVSFMEDGRVITAYQLDTNSPNIVVQVGDTPAGPFYPRKKVWETPEIYEDIDFYTYNAKAYPHLSNPGELLISYNVNAFNFVDKLHQHPHHLRPRFIRVRYEQIN